MNKFKRYWWLWTIVLAVILTVIWLIAGNSNKAQYTEKTDGPHIQGNASSSVSLVEFSDFQCPACGMAFQAVESLLQKYGDKIKFEYRNFPLVSIHRYAYRAAESAECAADQGKFWEMHDLLFTNQQNLTNMDLAKYASQVNGLDAALWQNCLNSGVKAKRVDEDLAEGNKQGYNSTPTFILNGQKVEDWAKLDEMIKALVEPLAPTQPISTN